MLRQFVELLESGEKTPQELLAICLERIAAEDPLVRAWVQVAPQTVLHDGPLHGIPFGAKDIIETRGMATEYGSALYYGRLGSADAEVVTALRRAGAVLLGKTQTTAFAFFDPSPTRNPRAPGHTPGGSSAGSAAAVAAGMVPFALGTQTLGSVLRPASYCGVCGFKPTFGLIPTHGVLPLAPSLDTVGLFTQTAADMVTLWTRSFGQPMPPGTLRIAQFAVPSEVSMERAVNDAAERLSAGGLPVDRLDLPAGWDRMLTAIRTINDYEGARTHEVRHREFGQRIGRKLAELVEAGLAIPYSRYETALARVGQMRRSMERVFLEYSLVLSPAATGPAPAGYQSTGDPLHNMAWTALGVPSISIPLPTTGAPLGLQISAAWDHDDELVAAAALVESRMC